MRRAPFRVRATERVREVAIDADDIGGIVTSAAGSEAGVWVIAETMDLPTRFIRIVSTDDDGQYVLPDLPEATYEVFVRGYGLVDSERVNGTPGQMLNLDAVVAPDAVAAAQVARPAPKKRRRVVPSPCPIAWVMAILLSIESAWLIEHHDTALTC